MEIQPIPESEMEHLVTPFFRHQSVENVPQSQIQRKPVMEVLEVVELRFAGDKNYAPIFPANAMYRKDGHKVVTYAERFAEQYREFVTGADQTASGTPLERLVEYGITPAQLSLCRVSKVYSVEALNALEGQNLRALGMQANNLKDMARSYLADRARGMDTAKQMAELQAEIDRLKAANPLPKDEFGELSEDQLKEAIAAKTGARPRGNPSRDTLVSVLRELQEEAAA